MRLFGCTHAWEVKAKTFAPPSSQRVESFQRGSPELLRFIERQESGSTTVLMACTKCGKTDVTVMVGGERAQH
jgi:hypothetical protein